jgi:hypothetical protein
MVPVMAAALTHLRQAGARAWTAYEAALHRRPLATQATTSALLWGCGDLLAQRIEHYEAQADRRRAQAAQAAAASAASTSRGKRAKAAAAAGGGGGGGAAAAAKPAAAAAAASPAAAANAVDDDNDEVPYDYGRAALTAVFGGIMVGPVGHVWYANLDRIVLALRKLGGVGAAATAAAGGAASATATATTSTPGFIASKVLLDTAVMGPFYVAGYFAFGATVMDGGGWQDVRRKLEHDFLPTLAAEVCFWPAVQGVNFYRTPVHHQLLVVNALTVADAAFMSWTRAQDDWWLAVRERWAASSGGGGLLGGHGGGSETERYRWRALPEELPPPPKPHRKPKGGGGGGGGGGVEQQRQQQQQPALA